MNGRMKFLVILKERWAENAMVFYDQNTVTWLGRVNNATDE
ncbi:hypothetical protein C5S35_03960 [Candidatus Methanophagaceae archaeon]|jgi:hypothetical protein|nr:hypothetical protein C5S35_03960 [Methanophagales archaeon]